VRTFVAGGWADSAPDTFRRDLERCLRLRDARLPEVIMFAIVVLLSQILYWTGATSGLFMEGRPGLTYSAAHVWYALVALPFFQFLSLRWVWRWGIWCYLLWRMSRLELRPVAAHPDRRGGLGFLVLPSVGMGWVLAGLSSVLAGAWANQVLYAGVSVRSFESEFMLLVVICEAIALGPLLFLSPRLWIARLLGRRAHSLFSLDYARRFEHKWMGDERLDPLGSPDIQSLADMQNSYNVVSAMLVWPFGPRHLIVLAVALVVPMVPLMLTQVPLIQLVRELGGIAIGAVPK
jgi:hypothetical protein